MSRARDLADAVGGNFAFPIGALANAPDPIQPGTIAFIGMTTPPTGWLKANGAAVSRTTYADLFAAIQTTYGAGDGSTTFNLPDLRGEFPRGFDDGRGVDSGRSIGTAQGSAMKRLIGEFRNNHGSNRMNVSDVSGFGSSNPFVGVGTSSWRQTIEASSGTFAAVRFDSARIIPDATNGDGLRPRNVALLACIKF